MDEGIQSCDYASLDGSLCICRYSEVAGVDAIGSQGFVQIVLGANLNVEIELKFGGFN